MFDDLVWAARRHAGSNPVPGDVVRAVDAVTPTDWRELMAVVLEDPEEFLRQQIKDLQPSDGYAGLRAMVQIRLDEALTAALMVEEMQDVIRLEGGVSVVTRNYDRLLEAVCAPASMIEAAAQTHEQVKFYLHAHHAWDVLDNPTH